MKHIALLFAACCLMLGACAQNTTQNTKEKENKEMKKTLIVYFSATGTTKAAAQKLAKEKNADLFEIVPEQPYTAADLDWRDKTSRSTIEMNDKTSRPPLKAAVKISLTTTLYGSVSLCGGILPRPSSTPSLRPTT